MKRIKVTITLCLALLCVFLVLDRKSYYYGFGNGLISSKIPDRFEVVFAGSDLGNQGVIIEENQMGLWIINRNDSIFVNNDKDKIFIQDIKGYWYNNNVIIASVLDSESKKRYIEIYEESSNELYPNFICNEMKFPPDEFSDVDYIDLEKSLDYFKRLKLIKNLSFLLWVISVLYLLRTIIKSKRNSKRYP